MEEVGGAANETSLTGSLVQAASRSPGLTVSLDAAMTSKVKPEIRRIGSEQFPRWVILDGSARLPTHLRFWNGEGWVEGLRNAMLFAHKNVVLRELKRAKGE